ncbi:417_t:CDS:1, partial [Acaulospora morrowiae]
TTSIKDFVSQNSYYERGILSRTLGYNAEQKCKDVAIVYLQSVVLPGLSTKILALFR